MSKDLTVQKAAVPALAMNETELMSVLRNSLYPGAKDESIKLVIGYCKASGLDPMQKPVHIVPMLVATGKKKENGYDEKEYRDVIMPGIGLYRTQASRSGDYAGVSEPSFGDPVTVKLGDVSITYPEWCRVTVRRCLPSGQVCEFTALEFWVENYATKSNKTVEPNAMWYKRPYAQLAKCTEAQALRKAFPEIGSQPTAEEMEGKFVYNDDLTVVNETPNVAPNTLKPPLPLCDPEKFEQMSGDEKVNKKDSWKTLIMSGKHTPESLIAQLETKMSFTPQQILTIQSWGAEQNESTEAGARDAGVGTTSEAVS